MYIPLIPKDMERDGFTCRDGEVDFMLQCGDGMSGGGVEAVLPGLGAGVTVSLTPVSTVEATLPHTVRIALQSGERPKAELLLGGDAARVDPEVAERLTQEMVRKAAEILLDLSTDLRRQGLFILPFRYYTMVMTPEGDLSYPSPQGVALPAGHPPHPEIMAASVTDDCMTLAIRFPVTPHRLTVTPPENFPAGHSLRTFVSYPLYIPDPKEMRGSIGSVRSAAGGQAMGIRFAFLSVSALKASVAAPEKYHELTGNERTGYRFASKAAPAPDYSCHASGRGFVAPFPRVSLLALGDGVDADTDPMDWIADWEKYGEGYLPASLPYKYWRNDVASSESAVWPEGIDAEEVLEIAGSIGSACILLTRPMTLATHEESRRHAEATAIRRIRVLGIRSDAPAFAVLYGSDDGVRWSPLRRFDPRMSALVLTPPRLFWRLLLCVGDECRAEAVFLE